MADEKQRFYPRPTGNAEIDAPLQMLFKGLYDIHDAFNAQAQANLPVFADNATAIAGGLAVGKMYRTNTNPSLICVVS
jgi:hypothetical protein